MPSRCTCRVYPVRERNPRCRIHGDAARAVRARQARERKAKGEPQPRAGRKPPEHGTYGRWRKGCTDGPDGGPCAPCRMASRDHTRMRRHGDIGPEESLVQRQPHGTRSRYQVCTAGPDGGKCEECKEANRRYQLEKYHALPPSKKARKR